MGRRRVGQTEPVKPLPLPLPLREELRRDRLDRGYDLARVAELAGLAAAELQAMENGESQMSIPLYHRVRRAIDRYTPEGPAR